MISREAGHDLNRQNSNRGYSKLDVWNDAIGLFRHLHTMLATIDAGSLHRTAAVEMLAAGISVPAYIAEGYCRRSVGEYLYYLRLGLASLSGLRTRAIGLRETGMLADAAFNCFDEEHFRVENEILALIQAMEARKPDDPWAEDFREPREPHIH